WNAPGQVLARLGESAEVDLLLALRRGARAWPPIGRLLEESRPARLALTDEDAAQLLGPAAEDLGAAGLEVLWPADILFGDVRLRAVVSPTPSPPSARE